MLICEPCTSTLPQLPDSASLLLAPAWFVLPRYLKPVTASTFALRSSSRALVRFAV